MKKLPFISAFIITIILFSACKEKKSDVPEAFQEKSVISDVSSFKRGYTDLVEQLYADILKKNKDLKALEDSIENLQKTSFEITGDLNKFFENNRNYYNAAYNKIEIIQDSILREKIFNKLSENENAFNLKIEKATNLLEKISQKETELNDYYISLKILLTMKLNADYQNNNLPDTNSAFQLKAKYESLIKNIQKKLKNN